MSGQVMLHLLIPKALDHDVVDLLLTVQEQFDFMTVKDCDSAGPLAVFDNAMEKIRGRVQKRQIDIMVHQDQLTLLLATLQQQLANSRIPYWTSPVLQMGQLA